jgi:hypothetical protein
MEQGLEQQFERKVERGRVFLAEQGLNLMAVFDCQSEPVASLLGDRVYDAERYLILLGNGGPNFWRALQAQAQADSNDPVDTFSRALAVRFVEQYLQANARVLYPDEQSLPLQQLGALAGWHHPSPLGVGIHADYGLWFAYRAAVLTDAPLKPTVWPQTESANKSPCDRCATKPCLSACPGQALNASNPLDLTRCLAWRKTPDSSCATTCLARLACPVGAEQRYDQAQIRYHYGRSLASLVA